MTSLRVTHRLEYVHEYRDRHGKVRRYFNRRGYPKIALPGAPGSPAFMEAYNAARAALQVRDIGKERSAVGTVNTAIAAYCVDQRFLAFAEGTRKSRRAILERFREQFGDRRLATLERPHLVAILGKLKPFAARNWLKTLRGLMEFAVAANLRGDDPTVGIETTKAKPGRIHTWDEGEIAQFEAKHPIGSRARLAMALMLYTGQRRSDIIRMGPQHIRNGVLSVRQQKTGMEKADEVLEIPVHPELARIITGSPCGNLAFLVTVNGAPFNGSNFGNFFREWCVEAKLPQCSPHGLRKATCRRLAELGCSAPQIAAISGHKTLREVQRYIEAADRKRLARQAMQSMAGGTPRERQMC
jgi:integrase